MTTYFPADTIAVLTSRIGEPEVPIQPFNYPPPISQIEEASAVPPILHLIPAGVDPSNTVGSVSYVPSSETIVNP